MKQLPVTPAAYREFYKQVRAIEEGPAWQNYVDFLQSFGIFLARQHRDGETGLPGDCQELAIKLMQHPNWPWIARLAADYKLTDILDVVKLASEGFQLADFLERDDYEGFIHIDKAGKMEFKDIGDWING